MKTILLLTIASLASCQRYYGSYGQIGSGFGSGGAIIFPNEVHRPSLPVRPTGVVGGVRPIGVVGGGVQPIGIVGGGVRPTGVVGGVQPIGVVRPTQPIGGQPIQPVGIQQPPGVCSRQSLVHGQFGTSDYHFSWCADGGQKYEWASAVAYCARLGQGWSGVSIEDFAENQFVTSTITAHRLSYIWTSGQRSGFTWAWASGLPFTPLDWSHTGFDGTPQPDNRENGAENCLAVLNNFYNDGVKWHDIACHHTKPIICERRRTFG